MNEELAHYLFVMMYSSSQHIPGDEFPGQVPDNRPGFFIRETQISEAQRAEICKPVYL
jgi:hypothetical protein